MAELRNPGGECIGVGGLLGSTARENGRSLNLVCRLDIDRAGYCRALSHRTAFSLTRDNGEIIAGHPIFRR